VTSALLAAFAAAAALGAWLLALGLRGQAVLDRRRLGSDRARLFGALRKLALAGAAAAAAILATRWLAAGVAAGAAVMVAPQLMGGRANRAREVARTEAIASWTEMVRDSVAAASGLEEAITATARVAPSAIQAEVTALVANLRHSSLPDALHRFGESMAHPSGDLVVVALSIASKMEASDLTGLLTRLAESTRGEARMRVRVDVGRTQVRTATRIILGVVALSVVLLAAFNRDYLDAYDPLAGQLVLAVVVSIFGVGGFLLTRMADIDLPARFTARDGSLQ
jgi:tight adherence protein B